MEIYLNQIPSEELIIEEIISSQSLDLYTEGINFITPLKVIGEVSRITNAVTVNLSLSAVLKVVCSRCLKELDLDLKKSLQLNYPVDNNELSLDLSPDIRQEIILDYPLKPLCLAECRGLCFKCGKNLNEGKCSCNKS